MSVILVTGASTGIGQATALHLASKGHQIFAGVRSPDKVDELRDKIAAENLSVEIIQLDITDQNSVDQAVSAIVDEFSGVAIDRVAGVESRGFIFGAPVAYRIGAGFVPVRKAGP